MRLNWPTNSGSSHLDEGVDFNGLGRRYLAAARPENDVDTIPSSIITDAIIDLRVSLGVDGDLSVLAGLAETLRESYPRQELMFSQRVQAQFSVVEGQSPSSEATQRQNGFRLYAADGLSIALLTLAGFTFIRLKPYNDWETFSTEARRIWGMYKTACYVESVSRAAIRYIDRLDLPFSEAVDEYLLLHPYLPEQFPTTALDGFFMQLQMPQEDLESKVAHGLARLADPAPEMRSFVLDFDLFCEHQWDADHDDDLWEPPGVSVSEKMNFSRRASLTERVP